MFLKLEGTGAAVSTVDKTVLYKTPRAPPRITGTLTQPPRGTPTRERTRCTSAEFQFVLYWIEIKPTSEARNTGAADTCYTNPSMTYCMNTSMPSAPRMSHMADVWQTSSSLGPPPMVNHPQI